MNLILLLALIVAPTLLHAGPPDARLISKIDNLYTPHGFDDNDVVEVVISGHFPSSCYQLGEAITEIDHDSKSVVITPISYRREGPCYQMVSRYSQVIKIGKMLAGEYTFRVRNNAQLNKVLDVKHALASEQDDYLYPPVEYADVTKDAHGDLILVIKGRYPRMKRGCMVTSESIIQIQDREMLVVQPKAEIDYHQEHNGGCQEAYENSFKLPFAAQGELLVHVRSINGQSYNRVVDLD